MGNVEERPYDCYVTVDENSAVFSFIGKLKRINLGGVGGSSPGSAKRGEHAAKVEAGGIARWSEEHKMLTNWSAESAYTMAYGTLIYSHMKVAEAKMKQEKQYANKASKEKNTKKEPVQSIDNKFPKDNQAGKSFNYTIKDGKIYLDNGVQEVDFVVDMNGNLIVGRGHSY